MARSRLVRGGDGGTGVGKMRKIKRRDDVTTRSSNQRQKTRNRGEKKKVPSGFSDFGEDVWRELGEGPVASNLSPSVVALASFDGGTMHSTCTGIVVKTDQSFASATIATSASLLRNFSEESFIDIIPNLTIKVRLPNNQVVPGRLHHYDLQCYIVFLTTMELFPDLCAARLNHDMQVEPINELVAVRRCFNSGKLMASTGVLIDSSSEAYDVDSPSDAHGHAKVFMFSTCKITATGTGGPLVDFNGNIVGMNFYARERTPFLPRNRILECLGPDLRTMVRSNQEGCSTRKRTIYRKQKSFVPNKAQKSSMPYRRYREAPSDDRSRIQCRRLRPWESDAFTDKVNEILRSDGYPLPIYFDDNMELRGSFEEAFGKDMCTEPIKKVALKMSCTVVSLASFNGKARFFVCSGVFIDRNGRTTRVLTSASLVRTSGDENKIDRNLRIEVCLPSKRRVIGTLEHYSLCYNVAVVSIMGSRSHCVAKLDESPKSEVVALGRGFESGNLMATCGVVADKPSRFDCKELMVSTCKITKAGIGGPLVDFDGNFIGMNFYDMEETPYLPRDIILELLRHFDAKRTVADGIMDKCTYRWPVPDAYWYYPSLHYVEEYCGMVLE